MSLFRDKSKEEQNKIDSQIETQANILNIDSWDNEGISHTDFDEFGLCGNCHHVAARMTRYGKTFAWCNYYNNPWRLNSNDPITVCTHHVKRGTMSLSDMKEMAILIDVGGNKIGFINEKEKED